MHASFHSWIHLEDGVITPPVPPSNGGLGDFSFSKDLEALEQAWTLEGTMERVPAETHEAKQLLEEALQPPAYLRSKLLPELASLEPPVHIARQPSPTTQTDELEAIRQRKQQTGKTASHLRPVPPPPLTTATSRSTIGIPDLSAPVHLSSLLTQDLNLAPDLNVASDSNSDLAVHQANRILELSQTVEELQRDNEILAQQLQHLLAENNALSLALHHQAADLEHHQKRYKKIWGNLHIEC